MATEAEVQKLAEFRAKTDRQLLVLISNRLDRGLSFARLLLDEEARQRWACMDEFVVRAEAAHREVSPLLRVLGGVTLAERRQLESRLAQLREILDCATLCAVPRV